MTCTNAQQRGATTRLVFDFEAAPKVAKAYASRAPKLIPVNAADIAATAPLNAVETIRGDRNPSEPFTGFTDVSGNLTVPMDTGAIGLYLKAALGQPASHLAANPSVAGQDHMTGTPRITIASSGAYTFSAAQTSSAAQDVVVYTDGTSYFMAYISTRTNDTTGVVQTVAETPGDPATGTFDVVAIIDSVLATVPNDVEEVGADGISSTGLSAALAGDLIFYNGKVFKASGDYNAESEAVPGRLVDGSVVGSATGLTASAIIRAGQFRHVYTTGAAACTPTFTVERQWEDIDVPFFERFTGLKLNEFSVSLGADEELVATLATIGCDVVRGYQPYDRPSHLATTPGTISITSGAATTSSDHTTSAVGDVIVYRTGTTATNYQYFAAVVTVRTSGTSYTVVTRNGGATPANVSGATVIAIYPPALSAGKLATGIWGRRLTNAKVAGTLNGIAGRMKTATLTVSQNIDGDTYELTGDGARAGLPEGIYAISGETSTRFQDARILQLGEGDASVALSFTATAGDQSLALSLPNVRLERRGPTMAGPAGVVFDSAFMAYKPDGGAAALTATLTNQVQGY